MPKVDRRDFLKLVGAGVGGTGLGLIFNQTRLPAAQLLIPQPLMPEDYSPGVATWYNTVCRQCAAGCGISVRTREGRAKKIEGNPLHPVNQGGSCSLGQSGLNVLYNPDRLTAPLVRSGERGSEEFSPIGWDEALHRVAQRLEELRNTGRASGIHLLTGGERGHLDRLYAQFMQQLDAGDYLQYEFDHPASLYAANKRCFAVDNLPYYDIGNSDYLISFGADYLGTWMSPVHYGRAYGHMRQGGPGRGYFVQVEPRMSLSGANADEWLPARPGSEGVIALALARHLVSEGYYRGADAADWQAVLDPFTLERAASDSGLDPGRVAALARGLAAARNPLALGGGAAAHAVNGTANMVAVNVLNYLAGGVGRNGTLRFNPPSPFGFEDHVRLSDYERMRQWLDGARAGSVQVLIVQGTNPAFTLPAAAGFEQAIRQVPLVIALSEFMDETTALADIVLPTHSYLESWGDDVPEPGAGFPVATLQQPVVTPLYDTLAAGDIVLELARRLELDFPWRDTRELLRDGWRDIFSRYHDRLEPMDFEEFWRTALQSGVWGLSDVTAEAHTPQLQPGLLTEFDFNPPPDPAEPEYAFSLQPFLSQAFYDGRGANLPWLQELSDPITGIAYGTWVELNPKTAADLGVREGDVLELTSPHGSLLAPAFIYPAIRPDVIGVPIGQGHTAYGRYARNRGANPLTILSPHVDRAAGALAWAATRINVRRTRQRARIIKTSGDPRELGRGILGPRD